MVLEKLVTVREAVKRPWSVFLLGIIVTITSLMVSHVIFPQSVGLFTTFVITICVTPFMYNLIKYSEAKSEELIKSGKGLNLLARHRDVIIIFASFFAGIVVAFTLLFLFLPEEFSSKLFQDQVTTITLIRGSATFASTFWKIVANNIGVLTLTFIISFLYGSGAVFILAWNASILGTVLGMTAKSVGGLSGLPLAILIYFPHGSLEMLAYFIGGVGGGIASAAITRKKTELTPQMLKDSFKLFGLAVILLLLAGIIETTSIVAG